MTRMMHLISVSDLTHEGIYELLDLAVRMKEGRDQYMDVLKGRSLAMIFEKPSTRTRVSFEVAMTELGGHALYLNYADLQLGRSETICDTASVLSRYVHAIMARVYRHETVRELARCADVPVINALSDMEHPCQLLADLLTIQEQKGDLKDLRIAWIGDGNNVCNSLILGSAITGMNLTVACPAGYEPDAGIVARANKLGSEVLITNDPIEAASGADVLYTDVWVSMGDETEEEKRLRDFSGFQINSDLLSHAKSDCIVLHCLPAHRGQEISAEVLDGEHSVVLDQAENRLHAQKALLMTVIPRQCDS
uniref:Ornithine carbamoyltransferase n=1 Tax=Candidatus Methanogaster sp. ANME-2c ERB4 TaxID=2759911 RepID=A0A7G9YMX5_9EURY|nr:ornithine carbamoyltransferase, anabolic [Methanosarcinales archaeon ANME-2c ERB4]